MQVIDLREDTSYLGQYIELRNRYAGLLLTSPVGKEETAAWLERERVEVRGLASEGTLWGAAVLYLNKEGEIAFFTREKNRGLGTKLLALIEEVAWDKGLLSVWAWVLKENGIAQRAFEKRGFIREGLSVKRRGDVSYEGVTFRKTPSPGRRSGASVS